MRKEGRKEAIQRPNEWESCPIHGRNAIAGMLDWFFYSPLKTNRNLKKLCDLITVHETNISHAKIAQIEKSSHPCQQSAKSVHVVIESYSKSSTQASSSGSLRANAALISWLGTSTTLPTTHYSMKVFAKRFDPDFGDRFDDYSHNAAKDEEEVMSLVHLFETDEKEVYPPSGSTAVFSSSFRQLVASFVGTKNFELEKNEYGDIIVTLDVDSDGEDVKRTTAMVWCYVNVEEKNDQGQYHSRGGWIRMMPDPGATYSAISRLVLDQWGIRVDTSASGRMNYQLVDGSVGSCPTSQARFEVFGLHTSAEHRFQVVHPPILGLLGMLTMHEMNVTTNIKSPKKVMKSSILSVARFIHA